ncbi:hypothetical protein GGR57DRAFT_281657 [Xylariaceae sp. FL1272]|nr:hypothetical protein GGR57DRAFT_281657 [Xylariaceae sp. FL1272]
MHTKWETIDRSVQVCGRAIHIDAILGTQPPRHNSALFFTVIVRADFLLKAFYHLPLYPYPKIPKSRVYIKTKPDYCSTLKCPIPFTSSVLGTYTTPTTHHDTFNPTLSQLNSHTMPKSQANQESKSQTAGTHTPKMLLRAQLSREERSGRNAQRKFGKSAKEYEKLENKLQGSDRYKYADDIGQLDHDYTAQQIDEMRKRKDKCEAKPKLWSDKAKTSKEKQEELSRLLRSK